MLSSKNSRKLFYCFNIETKDKDIREKANHIDNTWNDIEYLYYVYHCLNVDFCETKDSQKQNMLFNAIIVLSKSYYVYLGIIEKLLGQLVRKCNKNNVTNAYNKQKSFWERVNRIRNCIVIHKDKSYFYEINKTFAGTDKEGISLELVFTDKKGTQKKIKMLPLVDIELAENYLKLLEKELNP